MKITIIIILIIGLGSLSYMFFKQPDIQNNPVNSSENKSLENNNNADSNVSGQNISNKNRLDLSNQGLNKIPDYVFKETNLQELNVSYNNLSGAIQAEIRHLSNLRILNASNNQMTGVPAEVGQLENLEILDLSYNQLTGLPYELGNLKNLKTLNISGNNYSQQDLDIIKQKLPSSVNIIK